MRSALHRLFKRLMGATLAACLGLSLMLTACDNGSRQSSFLKGDYVSDTVLVAERLKKTIEITDKDLLASSQNEAIAIITEYISIYRNRPKTAGLDSFTRMQTALNSLAGFYQTTNNRPLSDALRERISSELTKAEDSAAKDS